MVAKSKAAFFISLESTTCLATWLTVSLGGGGGGGGGIRKRKDNNDKNWMTYPARKKECGVVT